jgi:hypothetical protein
MGDIKTNKHSIDKAAEFFLKEIHTEELDGDLQVAVRGYRSGSATYEHAFEFLTECFREDLESWIIENKLLSVQLKCIQ